MRADAYRRQNNLAGDVAELLDRVNPKNVLERTKNEAVDKGRAFFLDSNGKPKPGPAAGVGGATLAGIAVVVGAALLTVKSKQDDERNEELRQAKERVKRLKQRPVNKRVVV
nr:MULTISPECIES: DUF3618 domain-containing protein [Helcobacillus]